MQELTQEGRRRIEDIAYRYGVSVDAALTLLQALVAGGGTMAQFSHPDLGGMGQWSQGGMTMVGDMFNNALKAKVDGLCSEIAGLLANQPMWQAQASQGSGPGVSLFVPSQGGSGNWCGTDLGSASSTGSQNGVRYAYFPATRRLAIDVGGRVTLYDTGDHQIGGVSQQQSGDASLTFTSQYGLVRIGDLRVVSLTSDAAGWTPEPAPPQPTYTAPPFQPEPEPWQPSPAPTPSAADPTADVLLLIERLAALRDKNILSAEEFAAKKTELLSRL